MNKGDDWSFLHRKPGFVQEESSPRRRRHGLEMSKADVILCKFLRSIEQPRIVGSQKDNACDTAPTLRKRPILVDK